MSVFKLESSEAEQAVSTEATGIQAAVRKYIHEHQSGGNLLKAKVGNGHADQPHVPVTFTGTQSEDKRTEFYLDKTERYEETKCALICTVRCELGHQNDRYYLCAEDDKVFLLKPVAKDPKDEKFMFQIKIASDGGHYCTIMSVSTGMFLASDDEGNASLKRFEKQPEDIQTWFHLMPHLKDLKHCEKLEADKLGVCSFNYDSMHFTASYRQASEVKAC